MSESPPLPVKRLAGRSDLTGFRHEATAGAQRLTIGRFEKKVIGSRFRLCHHAAIARRIERSELFHWHCAVSGDLSCFVAEQFWPEQRLPSSAA